MNGLNSVILIDSREPWPHPWIAHFSSAVSVGRGTLQTGDVALAALPEGAVIERKTVSDLLCCIGRERERFERELKRGRYVGRLLVIVEGTFAEIMDAARAIHPNAIVGTLAAWQRRYASFCFAGNVETAARIGEAFLCGQVREVNRAVKALNNEWQIRSPEQSAAA
jgi:DNA excision repair protein ERCC-4